MPHPIQSVTFTTDPQAGVCRSEDGHYSLPVDQDDNVQVHDASGEPIGVGWAMERKPVRVEGFFTDPLTGDALGAGGYYGLSRGAGGLIHAFDKFGNRSQMGASDVAAAYLAAELAPDVGLAHMAPAILESMVEAFVGVWDPAIPASERALDMLSPHGEHSKLPPYRVVCRDGMMSVTNHGSATRGHGIFCVSMDPRGGFHIRHLEDGPSGPDVERFARELHAFHFGKGSRRPRKFDAFIGRLLAAASRGLAGGPAPG